MNYSSPLQQVIEAGKDAFNNGSSRLVPNRYSKIDISNFAFLKGWDIAKKEAR